MKTSTFIRDIFRKFPILLIITSGLAIFVSIIEACSILAVGPLVDFLIHPDLKNVSPFTERIMTMMNFVGLQVSLGNYLVIFVIFVLLVSLIRILASYSIERTRYAAMREIMLGTFEDFFRARWYFFTSSKQGMLLNTFMRELNVIGSAFEAMALFFAGSLQLIFYLAVPFYISWRVTIISLLTALFFVWPFLLLGRINYKLGRLTVSTGNQIIEIIEEGFNLTKVILGFGNQLKSRDTLKAAFDVHRKAIVKSITLSKAITILYQPFGAVVLIIALFATRKFSVPLSEMTILLLALLKTVFVIGHLASYKNSLDNFFPSYEQIKELRYKATQLKQQSGDKIFTEFKAAISIENLSFAYPGHAPVLIDVNMEIPKGRMIAIVGESGAGKSTLVDMIMGFNEPSAGRITFDGINLHEFDINSYRKRCGYVPQDCILFNMSIENNLLWAKEDATEEEIRHACKQANANEFIEKFPQGYETVVGDRGVRLSGGQRQRIALARAILRKPELLFLDEATSSLDTHSERLIQQAIENIARETTIIVIAHRLSTIVNADHVYVLKQGRIIEQGTYSGLVEINGYFNRMVQLQLLETTKNYKE